MIKVRIAMQMLFESFGADKSSCTCPRCGNRLLATDINVTADTALCRQCGSALINFPTWFMAAPSPICHSRRKEPGFELTPAGFRASATTRSAMAWFIVPFMLVWSGGSLGGIYGSQFRSGAFHLGSSLFGIPFLLGTLWFGGYAMMLVCGRVAISRDGETGTVFEGIGPIGWTRQFSWSDIASVMEGVTSERWSGKRGPQPLVAMRFETSLGRTLKFGTLLSEERRWFLISVIRSQISRR